MISTLNYIRNINVELKKLKACSKTPPVKDRIKLLKERREAMVNEVLDWEKKCGDKLTPQFRDILHGYYIEGKYSQAHYVKSGKFAKIVNENCLQF